MGVAAKRNKTSSPSKQATNQPPGIDGRKEGEKLNLHAKLGISICCAALDLSTENSQSTAQSTDLGSQSTGGLRCCGLLSTGLAYCVLKWIFLHKGDRILKPSMKNMTIQSIPCYNACSRCVAGSPKYNARHLCLALPHDGPSGTSSLAPHEVDHQLLCSTSACGFLSESVWLGSSSSP